MESTSLCSRCSSPFELKTKGFKRIKLSLLASPYTSQKFVGDNIDFKYICLSCVNLLKSCTIKKGKKRTWANATKSPVKNKKTKQESPLTTTWMEKALALIKTSKYHSAFRYIMSNSTPAKQALIDVCCEMVHKEVSSPFINIFHIT
jgi:hypothetical protein